VLGSPTQAKLPYGCSAKPFDHGNRLSMVWKMLQPTSVPSAIDRMAAPVEPRLVAPGPPPAWSASATTAAGPAEVYLTGLGLLLTGIALWGLLFRPRRQWLRLGPDSVAVLLAYLAGMAGLALLAR